MYMIFDSLRTLKYILYILVLSNRLKIMINLLAESVVSSLHVLIDDQRIIESLTNNSKFFNMGHLLLCYGLV